MCLSIYMYTVFVCAYRYAVICIHIMYISIRIVLIKACRQYRGTPTEKRETGARTERETERDQEREREREGHTDRQTDRLTDRQTDSHITRGSKSTPT